MRATSFGLAPYTRPGSTLLSTFTLVRDVYRNGLRSRCCCSLSAMEAPAANLLQRTARTAGSGFLSTPAALSPGGGC
jgi:hypothetical protein